VTELAYISFLESYQADMSEGIFDIKSRPVTVSRQDEAKSRINTVTEIHPSQKHETILHY
jgi:hypothetical protein